jgi:hypothetical protein
MTGRWSRLSQGRFGSTRACRRPVGRARCWTFFAAVMAASFVLSVAVPVVAQGRSTRDWQNCSHGVYPRNGAGGPGTSAPEVKDVTCKRAYTAIKRGYITQTEPSNLRTRGFVCTARMAGVASSVKCVHGRMAFKFTLGT